MKENRDKPKIVEHPIDWSKIDLSFESIADFQDCICHHGEVGFDYNGRHYHITHPKEGWHVFYEDYKEDIDVWFEEGSEDLLNHEIEGKKLREIITEVTVTDRTV